MKTIVFMRHANALSSSQDGSDALRPLSPKGLEAAARAANVLKTRGVKPFKIITSPKLRATQTAETVSKILKAPAEERLELGGAVNIVELWNFIKNETESGQTLVVIGHNPDISSLVTALVNNHIALNPAEFATVKFSDDFTAAELEPINPL
ncbi:MAG: histidine phosphatase family protein [Elusimicrobium sp.]|jgi:phosphohistidine phosphatase|nr:histidine phosphatase family protein [Elusimicrobium sp.]